MPQNYGITYNSSLPGTQSEGGQKQMRVDRYGGLQTRNELTAWAEEGSYYRALASSTPGNGIAQAITTAFSATAVPLVLVNGSASKAVIPHYIRLTNTAAGASTTSSQMAISIDTANRYSSGGTDLTTLIYNSNTAQSTASVVSVLRFGTVTASAAGAGTRYIANSSLKVAAAPCWVVGDEIKIIFSGDADSGTLSGTAAVGIAKNIGPVVLSGQNSSLILHLWNPANATTAPSWALEMAWWER